MELLAQSNVGRDINRPYIDATGIKKALEKTVTKALTKLIKFRNSCDAFNGDFEISNQDSVLQMSWENNDNSAVLIVNLVEGSASIKVNENNNTRIFSLDSLLNDE